jgi:dihydroflavonol-4-reductase
VIVITGATGHLGNTLVRELRQRRAEEEIRCLVLPGEDLTPLDGLDVSVVRGDVRRVDDLSAAFSGADIVFHLASVISLRPDQAPLLTAVNVGGTRNVIAACRHCKVRRLVYTSSIHALIEPPHGVVIDEDTPIDPLRIPAAYGKSKAAATLSVLAAAEEGLDAVVVCPTGIIGPNDYLGSEMGRMFATFMRRRMPAYIDGAYDFVDVRDVAAGLVAAAERGRRGQVYILSGEHITVRRILEVLGEVTSIPVPRLKAPPWLAQTAAAVVTLLSRFGQARPLFTLESLAVLRSNALINRAKAMRELGWRPRPLNRTIADTAAWLRESGRVRAMRPAAAR